MHAAREGAAYDGGVEVIMSEGIPVATYDRLSTKRQSEVGYAGEGHSHELRERLGRMDPPRQIVEEVPEPGGEKRWMLECPGLERIKELARAGTIKEVWAWGWDRYGQSPVPEVLAIELGQHGVVLRALDDGGEGFGGEIVRAVRSVISAQDMRDRVRKVEMGKRAKARKGHILGAGQKPRYGFSLVRDDKGKVIGYEPYEPEMAVVRRIVSWLAEGHSMYFVQRTLETEGVPAPSGGLHWSRTAPKRIVIEDAYLPHTQEELAALVADGLLAEEVYASLNPAAGPFGLAYYGRTRSRYVSTHSKKRKVEKVPRSEWVAIPVPLGASAPLRSDVERARASVADNRVSAQVGGRFWELSRGFLAALSAGARWPPTQRATSTTTVAGPDPTSTRAKIAGAILQRTWSIRPRGSSSRSRVQRPCWHSMIRPCASRRRS
jgi:DNA invertase Pin-like site-specific DNA recombinase